MTVELSREERIRFVIEDATMPYCLAQATRSYLRQTAEYGRARAEGCARTWLDTESLSLGHSFASILRDRLDEFAAPVSEGSE